MVLSTKRLTLSIGRPVSVPEIKYLSVSELATHKGNLDAPNVEYFFSFQSNAQNRGSILA